MKGGKKFMAMQNLCRFLFKKAGSNFIENIIFWLERFESFAEDFFPLYLFWKTNVPVIKIIYPPAFTRLESSCTKAKIRFVLYICLGFLLQIKKENINHVRLISIIFNHFHSQISQTCDVYCTIVSFYIPIKFW